MSLLKPAKLAGLGPVNFQADFMKDCVRLLMNDGTLDVIFCPRLTNEQLVSLLRSSQRVTTRAELRALAVNVARQFGRQVEFEEPNKSLRQ